MVFSNDCIIEFGDGIRWLNFWYLVLGEKEFVRNSDIRFYYGLFFIINMLVFVLCY